MADVESSSNSEAQSKSSEDLERELDDIAKKLFQSSDAEIQESDKKLTAHYEGTPETASLRALIK